MGTFRGHLIFETLHGSKAYGLDTPTSDTDIRGVFLPPETELLGFDLYPQTYQHPNVDTVYWDIRHFLGMALKSNPNALEIVFTDPKDHTKVDKAFLPVIQNRHYLLSKEAHRTFGGYAMGQLRKLEQIDPGKVTPAQRKDAAHCIRLLMFAKQILLTGDLTVKFNKTDPNANLVLGTKFGTVPLENALEWSRNEMGMLDHYLKVSSLPDKPDYEPWVKYLNNTLYNYVARRAW